MMDAAVRVKCRRWRLITNISLAAFEILALASSLPALQAQEDSICCNTFCKCTTADHPQWIKVSCRFDYQGVMIMDVDRSLENVTDMEVYGAHEAVLEKHALYHARNLRRISFYNCTKVQFNSRSIVEIASASLRIEVVKADLVIFDQFSLATTKRLLYSPHMSHGNKAGPMVFGGISLHVERCREVLMGRHVFSNIQDANFSVIQNLRLAQGALQLDPKAIVSHHGPELIIEFNDVSLKEIPKDTFASSAAKVKLSGVRAEIVSMEAFSATSIFQLTMYNCYFGLVKSAAFKDGIFIDILEIDYTTFGDIEPMGIGGGINAVVIQNSWFKNIQESGIDVSTVTLEFYENTVSLCEGRSIKINKFSNVSIVDTKFTQFNSTALELNPEIHYMPSTLILVNNNFSSYPEIYNSSLTIDARNNSYGLCYCNMGSSWMTYDHMKNNYCHESELNCTREGNVMKYVKIRVKDFLPSCQKGNKPKNCPNISFPEIKQKKSIAENLKEGNVLVISTVILVSVVVLSLTIYVMLVCRSKFKTCNNNVKITCRGLFLIPLCFGRSNADVTAANSISQLPIPTDHTEMQCLNPNRDEFITIPVEVFTADKATQSLPEELTKEFLEGLKKKLDDPASYEEAKAVVDHLYELVKAEETCNNDTRDGEENIYDLPLLPPERRIKRKNVQRVSVGTDTPQLHELLPLSPYHGQTSLCRNYFEPKDLAVHVYAEISNYARSKNNGLKSDIPDVLVGQAMPRGPFLRAMQHKKSAEPTSTMKSNSSMSSNLSSKMINRPLPAQPSAPVLFDPREGTSY